MHPMKRLRPYNWSAKLHVWTASGEELAAIPATWTERAQYPLIKEYALIHHEDPYII